MSIAEWNRSWKRRVLIGTFAGSSVGDSWEISWAFRQEFRGRFRREFSWEFSWQLSCEFSRELRRDSSGVLWRVRGSFVGAFVEGSWEFRKDFKVGVWISGREFREFRRSDAFFGFRHAGPLTRG